jgi:adenosine deaminase
VHYTRVHHFVLPSENLARQISAMPKVELHVHLEGATSPELIFKMARRNHLSLPVDTIEAWKQFYAFRDFNHFIEIYLLTINCMQTPLDFKDMVIDFMGRQAAQNIRYSEVFISSALHIQRLPGDEILAALKEGMQAGQQQHRVEMALIPDISRETCTEKDIQEEVLEFALKAKELGIGLGMGIGGKEIGYPSSLYRDVFAEARRQGLHCVAHAGETGDHVVMRDVLDVLQPERIGHGVHALGDAGLVKTLCERQIPLEVSPQSNYCTRVVQGDAPHPIRGMVDAGLTCTVNTDDPSMFSTDLANEYLTLAAQGFSFDELWQLNLNGLRASFLSQEKKEALEQDWSAWRQAWGDD